MRGGLWVDGWSGDRVSCHEDRLVPALLIFLVFAELMLSGTNLYTVSICRPGRPEHTNGESRTSLTCACCRCCLCCYREPDHLVLLCMGDGGYKDAQRIGQDLLLEHDPDGRG